MKEIDVGLNADRQHRKVALDLAAAPGQRALDPARAFKAHHLIFGNQLDSRVTVNARQHGAQLRSQDRVEGCAARQDR